MQTQSKLIKWSLIIAITILLNIFFNVSASLIWKAPEYNEFCRTQENAVMYKQDPKSFEQTNQKLIECQNNYDLAIDSHETKVFTLLIIFGVISFVLSVLLKNNSIISTAFSFASLLDFIIASMRYWPSANEWLRFSIVTVALVILIYIAVKKFGDK